MSAESAVLLWTIMGLGNKAKPNAAFVVNQKKIGL